MTETPQIIEVLLSVDEVEEHVSMSVEEADHEIPMSVEEEGSGSRDYNDLYNKPTLNGKTIEGAMKEEDPTVPDWAKQQSKPEYTPEEVGSVSVEDAITLEDIDKMISQIFN